MIVQEMDTVMQESVQGDRARRSCLQIQQGSDQEDVVIMASVIDLKESSCA